MMLMKKKMMMMIYNMKQRKSYLLEFELKYKRMPFKIRRMIANKNKKNI